MHVSMFMQWSTLTITNMFYILKCSISFFEQVSPKTAGLNPNASVFLSTKQCSPTDQQWDAGITANGENCMLSYAKYLKPCLFKCQNIRSFQTVQLIFLDNMVKEIELTLELDHFNLPPLFPISMHKHHVTIFKNNQNEHIKLILQKLVLKTQHVL